MPGDFVPTGRQASTVRVTEAEGQLTRPTDGTSSSL